MTLFYLIIAHFILFHILLPSFFDFFRVVLSGFFTIFARQMYQLTNLETLLTKIPLIKLAIPFTNASPKYPLTKLETPRNKESIDKISNTFY